MTAFQDAFAKAGLPPAAVSFAAACHDLAVLALNRQPDPARAAHAWLGLAAGAEFRRELAAFIASVAAERSAGAATGLSQPMKRMPRSAEPYPAGEEGYGPTDAQTLGAFSSAGPTSGGGGQSGREAHRIIAAPSKPKRGDGGHGGRATHPPTAAVPASRAPTAQQVRAVTEAKALSSRVMSGVYIPDHRGGSEPFDHIKIRFYDLTEKRLARAVGRNSVAYNLVRLAKMRRPANYRDLPADTASLDIFSAAEMRNMQREAAVFAGHGLISLPEELRGAVAEAVTKKGAAA